MKSSMKFTFSGFHVLSNSERKNFDGSPSNYSKEDIKIDSIVVDTEVEYTVEEMLAALANGGIFIKELPNLVTACVMAFKVAIATEPIAPKDAEVKVEAKVEEKVPEASEPSEQ